MDDAVLNRLVMAVNTILDPNSSETSRTAAHNICEECKENEMCHLIGYTLASWAGADPQVKHFGLALMQHFVHSHWVRSNQESQIQIKSNALSLLMDCGHGESCYVKDGIAHVVAEIAKHVWPQNWLSMVKDLISAAEKGPVQTELSELVFLRLAEDVAVLQNISAAHRSKDIRHGLSLSMKDIMNFFLGVLQDNFAKYAQLRGTKNAEEVAECNVRYALSCNTLKALQGFVEWINIEHLFMDDSRLLKLLSHLLSIEGIQILAAECLLLVASRRGKPEERRLVLQLITPTYTEAMVSAIQKSLQRPQDDEEQYVFLKRMSYVFSSLSGLIASSWGEDDGLITEFSTHTGFLDVLVAFLQHENPVVSFPVSSSWNTLLKNSDIRNDTTFGKYVPEIYEIAATRIRKDAKSKLPLHAQLDFNDEEEMCTFLKSYRGMFVEMVRWCTRCRPIHCVTVCLGWLSAEIALPVNAGVDAKEVSLQQCTTSSPSYIRWEALKSVVEMTFGCVVQSAEQRKEKHLLPVVPAKELFSSLVQYQVRDILLYQCLLSIVSSFLPLLELMDDKSSLATAILVMYSSAIEETVKPSIIWNPPVKTLRRHILSSLIHLCKYHTAMVMSIYDNFKAAMMELLALDPGLPQHEKVSIFEALILVSGEWNSFPKQSALIDEIMASCSSSWPDSKFFASPTDFVNAIGLCTTNTSDEGSESSLRTKISFCISLALGVTYRSHVPDNDDSAKAGGFRDTSGFITHPCSRAVLMFLEHIVKFVELFHSLWTPEIRCMVHPEYSKSLEMRDGEKTNLVVGNPNTAELNDAADKQPWEKMQNFILLNLENCYQILGLAGKCCGPHLYGSPNLIPSFIEKVFSNLDSLPELRMRAFTRQFLYYFLKHCPQGHTDSVAAPILAKYCQFLNRALQAKWNEYGSREQERLVVAESMGNGHSVTDEDTRETVEIMNEQLLRTISREYLEMLVNLCVVKNPRSKKADQPALNEAESRHTETDGQMQGIINTASSNSIQLTDLGTSLMEGGMAEVLLVTALASISWHDTATTFKAIQLLWPLLKHIFVVAPVMSDAAADSIFQAMLRGLRVHGQHDGCQAQLLALSLFVYVSLREGHHSLVETLKSIPKATEKLVNDFDANYKKYSEKKRKITFKKIVGGVIEQHVGQLFKTEQQMLRLPKILYRSRPPKRGLSPEVDTMCALFGRNDE